MGARLPVDRKAYRLQTDRGDTDSMCRTVASSGRVLIFARLPGESRFRSVRHWHRREAASVTPY